MLSPRLVCLRPIEHVHPRLTSERLVAKLGAQVVVPYRDEEGARHLRPMGDLGQIVPMVSSRVLFVVLCSAC
jgi:hypothetical protein